MAYTTIDKPSDYFNTKLYTGTTSTISNTGLGFQPDFVWCKNRTAANRHALFDVLRGTTNRLRTDGTDAEVADPDTLTSFDSDGFTVGADAGNFGSNKNGDSFTSWSWKANGAGSLNEVGSIDSTVSANTTSGFSIVSYTGNGRDATIGHGLGSVPKMIIVKSRSFADNWCVYHEAIGNDNCLRLNLTGAKVNPGTNRWNDTSPTSTVFSVGNSPTTADPETNKSGETYIAYCFADVKGYSKFGSYTGNGSTDGTFVYTGFLPSFVMVKRTDSTGSWFMYDAKRNTYNVLDNYLLADTNGAEATAEVFDFTSQGFKLRYAGGQVNTSGASMIYMAFAENPFVTSTGVPACAR